MRETTRQRLLRELGWVPNARATTYSEPETWLLVYVPTAVQTAEKCGHLATISECGCLGANNPRVVDQQVIMDWPRKYWPGRTVVCAERLEA